MCGIAGQLTNARRLNPAPLARAVARLKHRGPDDCGYWLADVASGATRSLAGAETSVSLGLPSLNGAGGFAFNVCLGVRRLAIFDCSSAGHQPMPATDAPLCLAFNGAIYNHVALRSTLSRAGYSFASTSDTEVLLRAWQHWGRDCFAQFEGMYAGAIVDLRARRATLFRDEFGIKPLYFAASSDGVAFASEIPALCEFLPPHPRANMAIVREFLSTGISDHRRETFVEGVEQLAPGHICEIDLHQARVMAVLPFWTLPLPPADQRVKPPDAAQAFGELLRETISLQAQADVALGASLSGGLDSSTIVGALGTFSRATPLPTFSYLAHDPARSELSWITSMERRVDCHPHHFGVPLDEVATTMDELIAIHGEPYESPAILAQYYLYREASRRGVRVILDGQGADELLGGYAVYAPLQLGWTLFSEGPDAARQFLHGAARGWGRSPRALLGEALGRCCRLPNSFYLPAAPPPSIEPAWLRNASSRQATLVQPSGLAPLHAHLRYSLTTSLPFLLRCADRNSMAWAVEARVPFLTRRLAEFCFSMPANLLISSQAESKALLREACSRWVTPEVFARKGKTAFARPDAAWVRALLPWVQDALAEIRALSPPWLDAEALRASARRLTSALEAPGRGDEACQIFETELWRVLVVTRWSVHQGVELGAG